MPTPFLTTYDFDQVSLIVGGWIVDGYAEGSGIELEQENPIFTHKNGVDGKVARSKILKRTAKLTISLMAGSQTNDYLGALAKTDMEAPNGAGIVPIMLKDNSGRSMYAAAQAWISELPNVTYADEMGERVWVISIANLSRQDAGN
jgi:hypothetical protein